MMDNRSIQDNRTVRAPSDQTYLVAHLARKHALTPEVRQLIARYGDDRNAFEREASKLNS